VESARHQEIAHSLFRESNDAFILFDPRDNRVVDLNPAALRLTGFERRAVLGMQVTDLFLADEPDGVAHLIDAYRKTGFFHSREDYYLKRKAGAPLAINISVSRIHTSPDPLGLAVIRDVSERRKAQEVLEQFFRFSPALFAIVAPEGRFARTNLAFEHVLGYSAEELRSKEAAGFLSAGPGEGGTEPAVFESQCRHKDGTDRWISWSTARVDGLTYAVGLDVTGAKQAAELRRAKDAAELASRAKGHFLARMSHELRTPLTAILGLVDVFMDDRSFAQVPSDRAEDIRTIKRNGEHLLQLINNVLDLSRIEEGKLDIRLGPCNPEQLTSDVVDLLRVRAEAKGLSLAVEQTTPLPSAIQSDAVYLRQILINLVGNAIKFTERGGVLVRVGVEREGALAPRLRFDVVDTGVGLAPEAIPTLFQPFHQVDITQKRRPGGTGLGLVICQQLAHALGGEIRVESIVGKGSTFTLLLASGDLDRELREVDVPSAGREDASADVSSSSTPRRVLLAEDNQDNRRAIGLRLQQMKFDVTSVRDGQEAYELAMETWAKGRPFDVILMDMQMPRLDGYEATRRLRSRGYDRPIIALTAYALDEDRVECLQSGCNEHIGKPIDWERLVGLVDRLPSLPPTVTSEGT
jgi:PAS domain S-box-containing protein